jgi:hypothetical protein
MNIQNLLGQMSAVWRQERSQTQLTLGKLIEQLEAMPKDAKVANLHEPHSYRGYYSDLAFHFDAGVISASELLSTCKDALGKTFEGYKGGDFFMDSDTPLWVANYGDCGRRLMAVLSSGGIEVATESDEAEAPPQQTELQIKLPVSSVLELQRRDWPNDCA